MKHLTWLSAALLLAACDLLEPITGRHRAEVWIRQTALVLSPGEQVQLAVAVQRSKVDFDMEAPGGRWWTDDPDVLHVSANGSVRGLSPGVAVIRVEVEGVEDSGSIRVVDPDDEPRTLWSRVRLGHNSACALDVDGRAYCWGADVFGQLGNGILRKWTAFHSPVPVAGEHRFIDLDVGGSFACGLDASGDVYCWGDELYLARSTRQAHILAPRKVDLPGAASAVTAGMQHMCALVEGIPYCLGSNIGGQLGIGSVNGSDMSSPLRVETETVFDDIDAGYFITCATARAGGLECWGTFFGTAPQAILEEWPFDRLTTGDQHICGIGSDGAAHCWGSHYAGQTGSPPGSWIDPPSWLGDQWAVLSAGLDATCGVTPQGRGYCWGSNRDGRLGTDQSLEPVCGYPNDLYECSSEPVRIAGDRTFVTVEAGRGTSCGITAEGRLYCWGKNWWGITGTGSTRDALVLPMPVADPFP